MADRSSKQRHVAQGFGQPNAVLPLSPQHHHWHLHPIQWHRSFTLPRRHKPPIPLPSLQPLLQFLPASLRIRPVSLNQQRSHQRRGDPTLQQYDGLRMQVWAGLACRLPWNQYRLLYGYQRPRLLLEIQLGLCRPSCHEHRSIDDNINLRSQRQRQSSPIHLPTPHHERRRHPWQQGHRKPRSKRYRTNPLRFSPFGRRMHLPVLHTRQHDVRPLSKHHLHHTYCYG